MNRSHDTNHTDPQPPGYPRWPWEILFVVICIGIAVWVGFVAGRGGTPSKFVIPWCIGIMAVAGAIRWPAVGLWAFTAITYGTPRYTSAYQMMSFVGVSNYIALLAVVGWALWSYRTQTRPRKLDVTWWVMLALVAWLGVCIVAAMVRGQPFAPRYNHHPEQYLQALAMFFLASQVLTSRTEAWRYVLVLCLTLCVRGTISGQQGLYLEGDLPALAVMALPLAMLGIDTSLGWVGRVGFAGLAFGLIVIIGFTQNRASALALAVLLPILWLQSRYKWRTLAGAIPILLIVGVLFAQSNYWQRFAGIWQGTTDRNSVITRFRNWQAGWEMFQDHPVVGVGPGNFYHFVQQYQPHLDEPYAAHNNFIDILAESGAAGLALYTAVFGGAMWGAWQVGRWAGPDWPGPAARRVLAALTIYIVVGCFISRHDMPLAYLLAGWGTAMRGQLLGGDEALSA